MRIRFILVVLTVLCSVARAEKTNTISKENIAAAEKIIGLNFSDAQREMMLGSLNGRLGDYDVIRRVRIPYGTFPAVLFNPIPPGFQWPTRHKTPHWSPRPKIKRPKNLEEA